eukprot:PITA_06135
MRSHWNERGIGWARENQVADIDVTAMGLRMLRLHGYNLSSDVLKTFRDENGEFFRFMGQRERGVTDMLNVNRCSHVAFAGETVMEEAKLCTERYMWNALENMYASDKLRLKRNTRGEVEYALRYPWHRSLPMLEARSYIEHYRPNDAWLGKTMYTMPYINNGKFLELANLDFNNVQSIHQNELREVRRWWKSSGFAELNFTRDRVAEIYFSIASTMFEPELAMCRAVYTKSSICIVIMTTYVTLMDLQKTSSCSQKQLKGGELIPLNWEIQIEAFTKEAEWSESEYVPSFQEYIETAFTKEAEWSESEYVPSFQEYIETAFTKEAEWSESEYVPSFQEYIETAIVSVALATMVLITVLFTGEVLTDNILSQIDCWVFLQWENTKTKH